MASKYVTDDGLDLDSRYLGINAKAKSAETADTADTVKSIDTQAVVDGIDLVSGPRVNINVGTTVSNQLTFTAAQTGIATLDIYNSNVHDQDVPITISVNDTNYTSGTATKGVLAATQVFLHKGDVVKATSGYNNTQSMRLTGYITPSLFIAKEVTE